MSRAFNSLEQTSGPEPMLLSYAEAARILGRSSVWLRRQVKAGLMPHRRATGSRSVFFTRADLDEFLNQAYVAPSHDKDSA